MGWLLNRKKNKQQEKMLELFTKMRQDANDTFKNLRETIFTTQQPDKDNFGFCETNPIFTESPSSTQNYISRLCTKGAQKFTWSKKTEIRATVRGYENVGEDVYTLYLGEKMYADIYVVPYVGESKFPPAGLYFCDDDTDWDLEREAYGRGLTGEQLKKIRELEEENAKFRLEFEQEQQKIKKEKEKAITEKAKCIADKYADFSIEDALKNDTFVFLSDFDIDLLSVYEYCHKEDLLFKKITTQVYTTTNQDGFYFDIMRDIEKKEMQQRVGNTQQTVADLQREAYIRGINVDQLVEIRNMEKANAEIAWNTRMKTLRTFSKQAINVQSNYPEFDLHIEWKKPSFRTITGKLGMLAAYEVTHFKSCYTQEPEERTPEVSEIKTEPEVVEIKTEPKVDSNEEKLFCRKCGTRLPLDSLFCNKCGTQVQTYN